MFRSLYLSRPWSSCFEGEDDAAKAAADKAAADKAAADAAAAVRCRRRQDDSPRKT